MQCRRGTDCPYVNGGDIWCLIAERDYLSQRLDEMERLMAAAEAEIEKVRGENGELKEENKSLRHQLKQMLGKIFKRQVKSDHDADRPKRGAPCGHRGNSRRRPEEISELVDLYPERCDQCGGQLNSYPNTFDEHVVEDIEIKKRVTCYRFHYGYCKRCQKVVRAKANGAGNPNDRIGVQARAVGGYLRYLGLTYRKAARLGCLRLKSHPPVIYGF